MNTDLAAKFLPAADWLINYKGRDLSGDLSAGVITAVLLVPQAMAYSALAGLPPEVGLYASILPPILYALFGSSRVLAVGPVAVASLMVASALGMLQAPGSPEYYASALILALLVGVFLILLGVARMGFVANFISHPVMSGFISAAAIVIAISQLKHLFGLEVPRGLRVDQALGQLLTDLESTNLAALLIGLSSLMLLHAMRRYLESMVKSFGLSGNITSAVGKAGPMFLVIVMTAMAALFKLDETAGLHVVGSIPSGLPPLTLPLLDIEIWRDIAPSAALIAFVSFVESVAIAQFLASKRREKLDVNQELVGLGLANVGAAFTGGSPVCGGFSRSVVNFSAGANTQLAALFTAALIALSVLFFTPLFYYLPQAVLAAIIIVAVLGLVDFSALQSNWHYSKSDALSWLATFAMVFAGGVEAGILTGIALSILLLVWRSSRPHIAIVGRVGDSEHFRNVERHHVQTCPHVLALRLDESLFFANAKFLENYLLAEVAERPAVTDIVLICSAVNTIDGSALESLDHLIDDLRSVGVTFHLAELKGPVMDRLEKTNFMRHLQPGKVFLSTHQAFADLKCA